MTVVVIIQGMYLQNRIFSIYPLTHSAIRPLDWLCMLTCEQYCYKCGSQILWADKFPLPYRASVGIAASYEQFKCSEDSALCT